MDCSPEGFAFEMGVRLVDRGGFVAGQLAPDLSIGAGIGRVGREGVWQGMEDVLGGSLLRASMAAMATFSDPA